MAYPGIAGVSSPIEDVIVPSPPYNLSPTGPIADAPGMVVAPPIVDTIEPEEQKKKSSIFSFLHPANAWDNTDVNSGPFISPEAKNAPDAPAPDAAAPEAMATPGGGAPLPLPAAPAAAPAPPPVNIGADVSTERTKVSKEALAGQAEQLAASRGAEGIAAREGELGKKKAQDAADAAIEEAKQKEAFRQIEAQGRVDLKQKLDAAYAERDRIIEDAQKQSTADYWSDKPAGAHALAMFSSALGTYVAIKSGSGKNYAQEEFDRVLARDDAKKQQILKNQIYRAGLKGQEAKDAYDYGLQEIALRKSALLDKLADDRAAKLAARGVEAADIQKDALINKAQMDSGKLKETNGHFLDVKVHASNASQQAAKLAALQAQQKGAAPATLSEREKAEAAAQQAAAIDKAHKIIEANPKGWDEYQAALKAQLQANNIQKTKIGAEAYNTLAATGAISSQLEQRLKSPAAKAIFASLDPVITAKARDSDPVGSLNQSSIDRAIETSGFMTRSRKDVLSDIAGYRQRKLNESGAAAGATGYVPPTLQQMQAQQPQRPAAAPAAPSSKVQIAQLVAWARKNPDAPGAKQALAQYGGK